MSIALIGGAGEGLGAALGRRFSKTHEVVLSSRTRGEKADLREEKQVIDLFERVERRGAIEVAIFNAGAHFRGSIVDTPAATFEDVWRLACYAGFLFGREAARRMVAKAKAPSSSPERPPRFVARPTSRPLPPRGRLATGRRSRWRASLGRRAFMSDTSSSTAASVMGTTCLP